MLPQEAKAARVCPDMYGASYGDASGYRDEKSYG